jgi:hypothetical protein
VRGYLDIGFDLGAILNAQLARGEVRSFMESKLRPAFESIESAQEFLALLSQTVIEAKDDTLADINGKTDGQPKRHVEALQMVSYNLEKLDRHLKVSRRILNDLRTLRRLLHRERPTRVSVEQNRAA